MSVLLDYLDHNANEFNSSAIKIISEVPASWPKPLHSLVSHNVKVSYQINVR